MVGKLTTTYCVDVMGRRTPRITVFKMGLEEDLYPRTSTQVADMEFRTSDIDTVSRIAQELTLAFGEGSILRDYSTFARDETGKEIDNYFLVEEEVLVPMSTEMALAIFN